MSDPMVPGPPLGTTPSSRSRNDAKRPTRASAADLGVRPTNEANTSHAVLCVVFCAASIPEAASMTNPNASVTSRLATTPGCAFGSASV